MRYAVVVLTLAVLSPLACDKGTPPTAEPAAAAPEAAPSDAPKTWGAMSWDEKKQHMMDEVTPKMASLFQGVAPEQYAEFNCVTCHGPGALEGKFKMPSDALPKLPPNGEFAALMEAKPDVMKFMSEQVVPQMAELLDTPAYDPSTHEGFGCYGCHQAEG